MARPVETQMTISCLQCDWSVEAVNTSVQASSAFLEAAHAHANEHEQHAIEVVQRLRLYSENYVDLRHHLRTHEMQLQGPIRAYRPASWTGHDASIIEESQRQYSE